MTFLYFEYLDFHYDCLIYNQLIQQFQKSVQQQQMSTIRDFQPLSKLGEGTYSTVYKVKRISDQQIYALKKVKMNQLSTKQKENALNEIRILASIQSPSIVSYKQAFFDETINVLCIVMEYAEQGDLLHVIGEAKKKKGTIEEKQIWEAAKSMLLGLQNLHCRGIMHRDLKSANVFKSKTGYKLGDLNVSKVVAGSLAYTQTGTPYYASPQVWRDEPYDAKSDIWSLGCIIYQMTALRPPFDGQSMEELYKNVQSKPIPPISGFYSSDLLEFIQICLKKKPSQRMTAIQILNYPKFQRYFKADNNMVLQNHSQNFKKQHLLNTIKLPSDLSKLKEKLPTSKYQSQHINKSVVVNSYASEKILDQRTPKHSNPPPLNKSQLYRSPPAKVPSENKVRSPISDIKLNSEVYNNIVAKYSDRLHASEKKSNKVQRSGIKDNYANLQKYIRQELTKRPSSQKSMPRTEKSSANQRQPQGPLIIMQSQPYLREVEEARSRLVKKVRVMSGHPKPSWWG